MNVYRHEQDIARDLQKSIREITVKAHRKVMETMQAEALADLARLAGQLFDRRLEDG